MRDNNNALGFPSRLEIEIASCCNLRCAYCPRRYLKNLKGFMDLGLFKKIIDEAASYPETIIVLHRRGESMLHPAFKEILKYTAGKFREVQIATNATLLDEDKFEPIVNAINFISFSIDVPEVFNKTRIPADYNVVEKKILKFLDFNKRRVKTQVSMVKTQETPVRNTQLFEKIWKGRVDRIRIYEEHSIGGVFGSLKSPRRKKVACVMPSYEMLIYDNGKVGRCNHDWNGSPMGDANLKTIKDIWNSPKYRALRSQHMNLRFTDLVCRTCDSWYPQIGNQGTGEVINND